MTRLVTAFFAGASCALAFAPYQYWPIYLIAIAFSLKQSKDLTPKQAFIHWLSFGFGSFAFGISWVHVSMDNFGGLPLFVSIALMALLALYLALYPAISGWLFSKLAPRPSTFHYLLVFPSIWVITEWFRGWMLTGFPWLWAGYSLTSSNLSVLASAVGVLGLSFIVLMLAGSLTLLLQKRWQPMAFVVPVLLVALYLVPYTSSIQPKGESVSVALVQGNIAQSMKWQPDALWPTLLKYMDLTRPHLDADIIIWPEAAIPAPEHYVKEFLSNANQVANLNNSAIITGIIRQVEDRFYNSLIVLGNHDQKQQEAADYRIPEDKFDPLHRSNLYDKHHLLLIGEFVPFESLLRPLAPFFNLPMSSFNRGHYQQTNLNALGYKITPAICYEIAFPEQLRANVAPDTDLLLTVSNDAWFGESNGPLQHMEIAQMRAIEMGRPLLRTTNNGVTAVVDHQGIITDQLAQFEADVLTAKVPLVKGQTAFSRWGQTPILIICGLILILAVSQRKTLEFRTRNDNK